jgi:uncharacterized protein (DUF58 family)
MELDEVRAYQPGDDIRHIDWNLTARSDEPFVRQARVERALDVWLLLDVSASTDWGTADCLKRERAIEFTTIMSHVLGQRGNRIGALLFAERPLSFIPPGAGRTHTFRMQQAISATPRQNSNGATNLAAALHKISVIARRRAQILVISDFIVAAGWQTNLQRLAQRHEVVAIQVGDPRERALPAVGLVTLEDPETGQQLLVNTSDRRLRERYAEAAKQQQHHLRRDLLQSGVDLLMLSTGEALLPSLVRFIQLRRLQRTARRK